VFKNFDGILLQLPKFQEKNSVLKKGIMADNLRPRPYFRILLQYPIELMLNVFGPTIDFDTYLLSNLNWPTSSISFLFKEAKVKVFRLKNY